MKRKITSKFIRLPPVRIFLNDLQKIVEALDNGKPSEIEHGDHEYESLEEFLENFDRNWVDRLEINARNYEQGSMSIEFKPEEVVIYARGNDVERDASYVKDLLRRNIKWYSWRSAEIWWGFMETILSMIILFGAGGAATLWLMRSGFGFVASVLGGFAVGVMLIHLGRRVWLGGTKVYLFNERTKPNFLERNSDAIAVALISSAISGIIAFGIGYFVAS